MMRAGSDTGSAPDWAPKQLLDDVLDAANDERLKRRITFPIRKAETAPDGSSISQEETEGISEDGDGEEEAENEGAKREASLSHILTNAAILQEFILEIVAVMQVRASMFGEVKFA